MPIFKSNETGTVIAQFHLQKKPKQKQFKAVSLSMPVNKEMK